MDELDRIGRFETVRLLGRGGMGEVYLARDPLIDRLVAVKLLSAAFDVVARDRFSREARAAGRLAHENIVTIFDVGEYRERPFIAMEYVPGETLGALIRQRPSPPRGELLRLIHDACIGLAFAHRSGVVHLDVKPENLIRREDGRLKILDFGLARVVAMDETHTRHSAGTLRYMSPEQLNGGLVDHRSDVFGLGCVLYEALTGQPAFGSTWPDVLARLNAGWVPKPSDQVWHLHPSLDRMTTRALALEPGDRYQDLSALAADLATLRREIEVEGPPDTGSYSGPVVVPRDDARTEPLAAADAAATVPDTKSLATSSPSSTPAAAVVAPPARRSALPWILGVAAAIAIVAIVATQWPQGSPAIERAADATPPPVTGSTEPPPPTATVPPAPVEPPAPPSTTPAPTTPAPAPASDVTAAPATDDAPPDPDEARERGALSASVWRAVARRDYASALRQLRADPALAAPLVPDLSKQARAVVDGARRVAEAREPDVRETAEYRAAAAALTRARRLDPAGRSIDGLAAEWAATDAFTRAVAAAAAERRDAATPIPTPSVPAPSTSSQPLPPPPAPRDVTPAVPSPEIPVPTSPTPAVVTAPSTTPPGERPAERPVEAPAPAPAAPKRTPTAEELVRAALGAYEAAYEAHDVSALRRTFVGLSADQAQALTRTFADAVSYRVDLRVLDVAVGSGTATATAVVTHALVPKVGSPSRTTQTSTFQLAPAGDHWVITRITAGR